MLLNCGVGEDSWESFGLQGYQTSQSWIFIGRTDAEAEAPILWPPYLKSWLIRKDTNAGKDWRQKGVIEPEMVDGITHSTGMTGKPGMLQSMGSQSQTQLSDWTTATNADGFHMDQTSLPLLPTFHKLPLPGCCSMPHLSPFSFPTLLVFNTVTPAQVEVEFIYKGASSLLWWFVTD